jgi:WS/DGAT/MGAT family acyltransferase
LARIHYERLSDESAAYLARESSRRREHTSMILVFEPGPFATEAGGVDFARIRRHVESRLPELPRLRAKLRRIPLDGHPVWVDDQEFNLDFHLRHSSLPRPGNHDQLCRTAARIAAGRLDRSRPLWDCWVLEGLEGGRFALVLKMHKALAHLEGADLLRALLSADPQSIPLRPARSLVRPAPSPVELFGSEVLRRWSPSRRAIGRAVRFLEQPDRLQNTARQRVRSALRALGYQLRPAGESPFDGNLSPHRAFAMEQVALEDVQTIRRAVGGSVHDVVLSILTGALRRFAEQHRISPATVDLRAVTPILDADGLSARAWVVELPIWEVRAAERQALLIEQTRRIRREQDVASAESLAGQAEWNTARLFALGARALGRIEHGQLQVLESPGPQKPLYLDGARLVESYGILPLRDESGLGITVTSYDGSLFFAFNADPHIVEDVRELRDAVDSEVADLLGQCDGRAPALRALAGQG